MPKRDARWLAVVVGIVAVLAAWHAQFWDQHAQQVSSLGRAEVAVATPYRQIRPDFTVDGHMWIRYAVALLKSEEGPQLRFTTIDNAPAGREVHWNSGLAWWLAGAGKLWQAAAGGTLEHGVERAAMWANLPLLIGFAGLFATWTARRGGLGAGVIVAGAMIGVGGMYEGFWPGYADHHGLIAAAMLGLMLGAFWMNGGWQAADGRSGTGNAGKRTPDRERAAARWSGFWGGFGLWVSAASTVPALALVGMAAVVATWAARRELAAQGARFDARIWRVWGRTGALTSAGFYLLEYFPHHLGWRLEVNHPLYALAWWAGAELTAAVLPLVAGAGAAGRGAISTRDAGRRSKRVRDRETVGTGGATLWWTMAWTVPAILAPAVAIVGLGPRVFLPEDPFLIGLHRTITEFLPLVERVRLEGVGMHFQTIVLYPLFYAAVVLWLVIARPARRFGVVFALVLAVALHALGFWQTRWVMSAVAPQVVLLIAVLGGLRQTAWAGRARWRPAALVGAMLAVFCLPTVGMRAWESLQVARHRVVLPGDARQLIYREVAEVIRESQPEGEVVLFASPNTSVNVAFFGGFKTLGTLYWENVEGLKAAAEISSAETEEEAIALIRRHGVTHVAFFKDSNYIAEYAQLLRPGVTEAEMKRTFGFRVLGQRAVPLWLEPLPYAAPKGLPKSVDPEVLVFRVNFNQTVAQGTYRLGVLQAKRGETEDALASLARAAELQPQNPAPRLRRGELLVGERRGAEAEMEFEAAIALAAESARYRLLTQAALAFESAGEIGRAIAFYERALKAGPTNVIAANNLAWLLAVKAPPEARDPGRALELARAAATREPGSAEVLGTLAGAEAANGNYAQAAETTQRALEIAIRKGAQGSIESLRRQQAEYEAKRDLDTAHHATAR